MKLEDHPVNPDIPQRRILLGIPMTGLLRSEWHLAFMSQIIPCNWSQSIMVHPLEHYSPIKYLVADARNLIAQRAVTHNIDWLFFIDHDVILPHFTWRIMNEYMISEEVPIIGGLYFTKSVPSEPLIYRGRGNGYFAKWKMEDKVWCDGMGLGCHLISGKLLKLMYDDSEEYTVAPGVKARRIYESPRLQSFEPGKAGVVTQIGTEDLPWYSRIIKEGYFKKLSKHPDLSEETRERWGKLQRKKYPFLCDTRLFCRHIEFSGQQFPSMGEENAYK